MSTDYTIIESSPIHVGNEVDYFNNGIASFDGNAEFNFGKYESKPFDCPGLIRGQPALLMFMSNDVHVSGDTITIKNTSVGEVVLRERIPRGVNGGDQSDVWMGNTLVVPGGILLPAGNTLVITSAADDDFRIDNIVVLYKSGNPLGLEEPKLY